MIYLLPVAAALADILCKNRIEARPADRYPHPLGKTSIQLEKYHNYGFSLGRFSRYPAGVTAAVAGIFTAALGLSLPELCRPDRPLRRFSIALLLAGSAGNLGDRLQRGYVVDYLRFPIRPIRRLIMNISDLCLFFGCLVLLAEEATDQK